LNILYKYIYLFKKKKKINHPYIIYLINNSTSNVDGLGTLRLLDAIRTCRLEKKVRFYQVSGYMNNNEMFKNILLLLLLLLL